MKFSLIISTRGRTAELITLFRSLRDQTLQDFEVILADQNDDDRVVELLRTADTGISITRIPSSNGLSRGRNDCLALAKGELIGFPDDDSAYVPYLLEQVAAFFAQHTEFGFLSGRSFADDGGDSVSRHAKHASEIKKFTIHSQCIEFALFMRRSALGATRFDEAMGVGAPTPWHSDEGPDLLLRLMAKGEHGYYDPRFAVWHPRPVTRYDARDIDRTFRYACGNGYFYRKHGYPAWYFAKQMVRTSCGVVLALLKLKPKKAQLYIARLRGRWKGWNAPMPDVATGQVALEPRGLSR
jgi:glycosyltransferase involved in cell wall biosynthesis